MSDALFAARLHLEKGTLLSDDAIRDVCRALVELHAQVAAFGPTPLEAVINASVEDDGRCDSTHAGAACVATGPHRLHTNGLGRFWRQQRERHEDWHTAECIARRAECDTEPCDCRPKAEVTP